MSLKNKKILITAGPTWVKIDKVRVISNTATGTTGILLANELERQGAKVTLVLGPCGQPLKKIKAKILRFVFFEELKSILINAVLKGNYDIVVHSAAVSDFRPHRVFKKKIRSGGENIKLNLIPTEKIIDRVKKIDPSLYLVGFKFEPGLNKKELIKEALMLARRARADIVIANTVKNNRYSAYIIEGNKESAVLNDKKELARRLTAILKKRCNDHVLPV